MQTPSESRAERLVVVPEADQVVRLPKEPVRRSTLTAAIAVLVAAVIVATAFTTYAVEHGQVSDAQKAAVDAKSAAQSAQAAANAKVATLEAQLKTSINSLKAQMASLKDAATSARTGAALESGAQKEAQRQAHALAQKLLVARSSINSVTGPTLANGTYVALVDAVGAQQSPQRVVLDLVQMYTGRAAIHAAIQDGFIKPGQKLPHGRYFRNLTSAWRIMPVSTTVQVILRNWRGTAFAKVTLSDLQQILSSPAAAAQRVTRDPFVVEVSGGQVTALRELLYP
jgi:hypothetical protein